MKPLRARYSKIEHLVQDLLRKHAITSPPVPVHDIAKSEGTTVDVHKFNKEISGLLLRTGDRAIIAVEKTQVTAAAFLCCSRLHEGRCLVGSDDRLARTLPAFERKPLK